MLTNCNECEKFIEKINWYRNEMLEMSKKLQAAQALAAQHLAEPEKRGTNLTAGEHDR